MSKHKFTTLVCSVITICMLVVTGLFMFGSTLGLEVSATEMPYVSRLFADDKVHTIDLQVDASEWADILVNAQDKEYITATVVVDGESFPNVAIRTKGNSSLSSIANTDSDRYSFKIEFDHFDKTSNYYGLDKLALNNIVQDNTYLKDYVSYQMMGAFEVDAPLTSFTWISVNGEDWGLYLAVEGIEDAFIQRNYDTQGILYKPDSMDMNANKGVGVDQTGERPTRPDGNNGVRPERPTQNQDGLPNGQAPTDQANQPPTNQEQAGGQVPNMQGGGQMGMSSNDVALLYTDDSYDSYQNIFDSAKAKITSTDKDRLIGALKTLSTGENLASAVNIDEVLRYFVVHNFVLNFDSYTGSMMHNYYLYESNGILSMVAWDYNLAFGGFGQSGTGSTATALINYPIDSPTSQVTLASRPMLGQLLAQYPEEYHTLFSEFITEYFDSGEFIAMIDHAIALISPYVEKDPSAFATYTEFQAASSTLREFALLRATSIAGQLNGTIPSTSEGQTADASALLDGSHINTSLMGSNSFGGGRDNQQGRSQDTSPAIQSQSVEVETQEMVQLGFDPSNQSNIPADTNNTENNFGQDNQGQMPNQPGANQPGMNLPTTNQPTVSQSNSVAYVWLLGSIVLMAIGTLFAYKFKK